MFWAYAKHEQEKEKLINQIINMYEIGIEIMQGVSGSIAIVLTVPLVSFISSRLLSYKVVK